MELSRRLARGRLSEILGPSYLNSDREVLKTGYTDDELRQQFDHLSSDTRTAIRSSVDGINLRVDELAHAGGPSGFRAAGVAPTRWDILDSVAITVHFLQIFGRGGAGELRSLAVLSYLKGQPAIGKHSLDILDDLAWQNDPDAIPTVLPTDDPLAKTHHQFPSTTRSITEEHLKQVTSPSFFELLSAIRTAERTESTRVAENLRIPYRTGSYCAVVASSRSADQSAMLMGGPQLGMKAPSIVHEVAIMAPGIHAVGMDIPGIPGVIIGHTDQFAWSITSGAADTDDIFVAQKTGTGYLDGDQDCRFIQIPFSIKVKGQPYKVIFQTRTVDGPVILDSESTHSVFSKHPASWMREMETMDSWGKLWKATSTRQVIQAMQGATLNFNFFFADRSGNIGWQYLGLIPIRATNLDPRFPTPAAPQNRWIGFLKPAEMPHSLNPSSGILTNWNNKPATWWPNFDTPTWGKIFENKLLVDELKDPKIRFEDLKHIPEKIAQGDETWPYFKPYLQGTTLARFDGKMVNGSSEAALYRTFLEELRRELFLPTTGSFLTPEYFRLILQPSVILRALEGKTKFDYLAGRTPVTVVQTAFRAAIAKAPKEYRAGTFKTFDELPIAYSNRGSTIQISSLRRTGIQSIDVLPPGEAEDGPHKNDQSALARSWQYKPMVPITKRQN